MSERKPFFAELKRRNVYKLVRVVSFRPGIEKPSIRSALRRLDAKDRIYRAACRAVALREGG